MLKGTRRFVTDMQSTGYGDADRAVSKGIITYHGEVRYDKSLHSGLVDRGITHRTQGHKLLGRDVLEHGYPTRLRREGVRVYARRHNLSDGLEQ
jgi:hypothetical protein